MSWGENFCSPIDHKNNTFISDGIVDPDTWFELDSGKRIRFLLKEAYGEEKDWSLVEWLNKEIPTHSIWMRVVEWTYAIHNTASASVCRFASEEIKKYYNKYLRSIAVVNLRKSTSNMDVIMEYTMYDKCELKEEIEMIDPDISILGHTIQPLINIFDLDRKQHSNVCYNWYYFTNKIGDRERLIIDYYYLAKQYPKSRIAFSFHIYPHRVLVYLENSFTSIFVAAYYNDLLKLRCTEYLFNAEPVVINEKSKEPMENYDKFCPVSDAEIVESHWKFTNKGGSRIFRGRLSPENNPLYFTLRFGTLSIDAGDFHGKTTFSRYRLLVEFVTLINNMMEQYKVD
ncbi:MAG: hypothetical protein E7508_05455 [Ruminococcus sp.]|nr:hypothetical protein [Ruminococcus sp.]